MNTFHALGLDAALLQAIDDMDSKPLGRPSQNHSLTSRKRNRYCGTRPNGTGKTAAFGFPMLQKIDPSSRTTKV